MTGVEARFAHYLYGRAPGWALHADQRFSYFTYVPPRLAEHSGPVPIVLVMHGTLRQPTVYRDAFIEFAEEHGCVVLAPLFPCGIEDPDDTDNYKRLEFHGIRFDLLLIQMVEEFAERYGIEIGPWLLHGFSGGGQFTHRFLLLHAERLAAASIGAPGAVTLLDDARDWWVGTRDIAERFGKPVDLRALRRVRVLTVIGEQDYGGEEVWVPETSRHWMPDANHAGADRQERLRALEGNLRAHGINVKRGVVPEVGHKGTAVLPVVREFFARCLTEGTHE